MVKGGYYASLEPEAQKLREGFLRKFWFVRDVSRLNKVFKLVLEPEHSCPFFLSQLHSRKRAPGMFIAFAAGVTVWPERPNKWHSLLCHRQDTDPSGTRAARLAGAGLFR